MKLVKKGIDLNSMTWYSKCENCGSIFESSLDELIEESSVRFKKHYMNKNRINSIELGPCEVCDQKTLVFYREDNKEISNIIREIRFDNEKLKYIYTESNNEN